MNAPPSIRDGKKQKERLDLERKNADLLREADMKGAKNANKRQNQRNQSLNHSQENLTTTSIVD